MYKTTVKNKFLGSSGFGGTVAELQSSAPDADFTEAKVLSGILTDAKINSLIRLC